MFSRFFIDRPIFAAVLSIFIVIAGLAAMRVAADRAVPGDRAAGRDGARRLPRRLGAEVLEQTVAAPLENAINGVEDMLYMSSTSASNGVGARSRSRSTSAPTSTRRRSTSTTA